MAKYFGAIGFVETVETTPGVWEERIIERNYRGDILSLTNRWQGADKVEDDFVVSNRISVISDPFAMENSHRIKYIKWLGTEWKVQSIEVLRPRLVLNIGGVYNEPSAS